MTESVGHGKFIKSGIGSPPRNPPDWDVNGEDLILSGEYYLDAHRNEIICHQVWTGRTDRGINKVIIWTHQGDNWIGDARSNVGKAFTAEEARRCWNHAVDNGATRVYMKANASKDNNKYQYTKAVKAYMKQDIMKQEMEQYFKEAMDKYADIEDKYYE